MTRPEFVVCPTSRENREILETRTRSLSIAAAREMESWDVEMKAERKESEGRFRTQWESKKAYDEAQSAARRNMGDMGSIGKRFW